ncbi:MAG: c-type cytochrome [Thiolinea sp.]
MYTAAADNNIKSVGEVVAVDKSIAPKARTGEEVFNAVCTSCHTGGVLNAPKLEKAAWEPRVGQGLQGLLNSAINGLNQMPARGGDPSITDQELKDAILYMTGKAGLDLSGEAGGAAAQTAAPAEQAAAPAETQQAAATPAPAQPEASAAPPPAAAPVAPVAKVDGEKVYKSICFSCHDVGVAGSPKLRTRQPGPAG